MHDSVVLSFHCVGKALLETKLRSSGLVALSLWIDPFCLLFFSLHKNDEGRMQWLQRLHMEGVYGS